MSCYSGNHAGQALMNALKTGRLCSCLPSFIYFLKTFMLTDKQCWHADLQRVTINLYGVRIIKNGIDLDLLDYMWLIGNSLLLLRVRSSEWQFFNSRPTHNLYPQNLAENSSDFRKIGPASFHTFLHQLYVHSHYQTFNTAFMNLTVNLMIRKRR